MPKASRFSCTWLLLLAAAFVARAQAPWPIRVVIVTTFEMGQDTGDKPGEFQYWAEREHLDETLPFPGGVHPIRANRDHTILGIVTGTTTGPAAASIMALGLDPRFDLRHAYWLVNGIAGVDPRIASVGSAAWAHFVVTDIRREIDIREAPAGWPYGIFPMGSTAPNQQPHETQAGVTNHMAYRLNAKLADWAFSLTKDTALMDTPEITALRAPYKGYPQAQRPPFVLIGDTFSSDSYWHGALMTQYAEDWVRLHTHGEGTFTTTAMEDAGISEAMTRLDAMGRASFDRLLVLRTASNYCMPPPGHSAAESVVAPYVGGIPALESAYRVGSTVIHTLVSNWPKYETTVPGE